MGLGSGIDLGGVNVGSEDEYNGNHSVLWSSQRINNNIFKKKKHQPVLKRIEKTLGNIYKTF